MCITFLYTNPSDKSYRYKLVLINNRDEFYARITLKAELKESSKNLKTIHGTDIEAIEHGTWLGLSQKNDTIRIGNLLNVAGETKKHNVKGRGGLVIEYINNTNSTIEEYNEKLLNNHLEYNGFNFLSIEIKRKEMKIFNLCNVDQSFQKIPFGYFGISNSPINQPYQKATIGTQKFKELLQSHENSEKSIFIDSLLNFLKCEEKHLPCQELARRRPDDAHIFSSIHVKHTFAQYGTRNRSIVLVDHHHNVDFIEERMVNENPENPIWDRQVFKIAGRNPKVLEYLISKARILNILKAML
ncbi:hypothetical protein PVAND_014458 [Polypedilum vanderplanki]|uniref:Uncharacterized protein n=1 Tax=Polypedilum vanderplanki TaxID=319348 RepID=A0A9J6B9Y5_POLVA|nr:hypothetical protein PVAND_014458 [Polypedilum vanderplanki]